MVENVIKRGVLVLFGDYLEHRFNPGHIAAHLPVIIRNGIPARFIQIGHIHRMNFHDVVV